MSTGSELGKICVCVRETHRVCSLRPNEQEGNSKYSVVTQKCRTKQVTRFCMCQRRVSNPERHMDPEILSS